jgi:hypothetical protein
LDGGHIFKDGLDAFISRVKKGITDEEKERYVKTVTYSLAFFILFLFIWQLLGPRI